MIYQPLRNPNRRTYFFQQILLSLLLLLSPLDANFLVDSKFLVLGLEGIRKQALKGLMGDIGFGHSLGGTVMMDYLF